jgi:5-methylcytosine-specific restriction endonuclease McrA
MANGKSRQRRRDKSALATPACGLPTVAFKRAAMRKWSRCQWCGRKLTASTATTDHIKPQSVGGLSEPGNMALSCAPCNERRGNKWRPGLAVNHGPRDWGEVLGGGEAR